MGDMHARIPAEMPRVGARRGRSMLGKQVDSRKATAPLFSWGTAQRSQYEKVFITEKHMATTNKGRLGSDAVLVYSAVAPQTMSQKVTGSHYSFGHRRSPGASKYGEAVPGPGAYPILPGIGKQLRSLNHTAQSVKFGTGTRDACQKMAMSKAALSSNYLTQSAPVGSYATRDGLGPQATSPCRTAPSFSFGGCAAKHDLSSRTERSTSSGVPFYRTGTSVGPQVSSMHRTLPSFGFGSGVRDAAKRQFITKGHAELLKGTQSPPGYSAQTPSTLTSIGPQLRSRSMSGPATGFGVAERLTLKMSTTPGPGAYE